MMYVVQATIETTQTDSHGKAWQGSKQVPTFYVNSDVQGFTGPGGAAEIARDVILAAGLAGAAHISVEPVPAEGSHWDALFNARELALQD